MFNRLAPTVLILILALCSCQKKDSEEEDKPTSPAALLDAAIQARGGFEKLKAASSWTGKWKGISGSTVHDGTQVFKDGQIRRDFTMPNGQEVTVVRGLEECWTTMGDKLIPCQESEKKFAKQGVALNLASSLWPLKEKGWELKPGPADTGEQAHDFLKATNQEYDADVTLVFNPKTHLASRIILHGVTLGNQAGDVVAEVLETRKYCGVVFYTKSLVTFAGQQISSNDLGEITCGPVDDKIFKQPEAQPAPPPAEKPEEADQEKENK